MNAAPAAVVFGLVEDSDEDFTAFSRIIARDAPGALLSRWPRAEATIADLTREGGPERGWPNILVVDLNLPGIDGCELVRRLREAPATRTLPIFVLSGSTRQSDIDRCYAAGANAYLTKPGSAAELRTLLQMLMRSLACFRAPSPLGGGPVELEAVDDGALEHHMVAYEDQLRAERDAERRGRERAEVLGRIAMRLAGLEAAAPIESAFTGELVGGGVADRAQLTRVAPGSEPADPFFSPQLMGPGFTGIVPVNAPNGSAIAQLQVEIAGDLDQDRQTLIVEAAALAGQALDRVARAAGATKRAERPGSDLPSRRWFAAAIDRELRRARGSRAPFTIVAVELDGFERISMQRGAVEADALLIALLDAWRERGHDLLSRHGDEEYAALLPGLGQRQARLLIAEVRRVPGLTAEFSTGIAQWDGREDAGQLVARAEAALVEERRLRTLT